MSLSSRHYIGDKYLDFIFDIESVQYNHLGRFFLKLTVLSSFGSEFERSKIALRKNDMTEWVYDNEAITDAVEQKTTEDFCVFKDHKFTFTLPKGFCKNDPNHDVFMLVESYSLPENVDITSPGRRVGEAKFAIYPRTNAPKADLFVDPGQNMYHFTDTITLLRTGSTDNIRMHCGRIKFTASFKECLRPPYQKDTPPPPTPPITPVPPPPKVPPIHFPKTPEEKEEIPDRLQLPTSPPVQDDDKFEKVPESPLPEADSTINLPRYLASHVSKPDKEEVVVIFHGASSLPSLPDGQIPIPYAFLKTDSEEENGRKAQAITHTCIQPTHAPTWEEAVHVEIERKSPQLEVLTLTVADGPSKQSLVSYRIPLSLLVPFHQYHLECVMPTRGGTGVKLYVTVYRKKPSIPRDMSSPNYCGLEVLLRSVQYPLKNPVGPLIAVARIVPDYAAYRNDMLLKKPTSAGIHLTTIYFPSPHPSAFLVPEEQSQGYPKVSLPGLPQEQPTWNHVFFFCHPRENATFFTPGAALVFEYYLTTSTMTDMSWRVLSPVGFSSFVLDQTVYQNLSERGYRMGAKVDGIPIQNTDLITKKLKLPTVGIILRLVTTERPDETSSLSNPDLLPSLEYLPVAGIPEIIHKPSEHAYPEYPIQRSPSPDQGHWLIHRKLKKPLEPIQDGELPPVDAVESILPEYQYIFVDPNKPKKSFNPSELDRTSMGLLDYQMKELDNYRTAIQKMGQDILTLRQHVRDKEIENSKLRSDLGQFNDSTKLLMDSQELDGLTKPQLAARYVAIKRKVVSQTAEIREYKERIHKLQNELIKKNDREREYMKVGQAHMSQNELLQKLQDKVQKVQKLEEAIRKQEKVIEKLERLLNKNTPNTSNRDVFINDTNDALLEENKRLRDELRSQKENQRQKTRNERDDLDTLKLYEQLDRAEARITSLEKQISDSAKQWGKEKADMQIRLNEAEHGLGRSSNLVLHDYPLPVMNSSRRMDLTDRSEPRRFTKAPRKGRSPKLEPLRY